MACEIDGNKHTFEEKINLKDYLSPLKESNIVKFSLSTNPSIILKCGVHAKFLE